VRWRWWALALIALAAVCLAIAGGFGQPLLVFPAPARGRPPAYPDRLVRRGDAAFLYFPGKTVVACFHGNGEDLADSIPIVSLLRSLGMGVLALEYPGYGVADGRPSEESAYAAADTALRWLKAEQGIDGSRTVLLGWSLGSGVAAEMARRGLGARLVLISPFTSVADMFRRFIPFFPASRVRYRFDTASKAPGISMPVMIIHGTEDEVVPFAMGERLARLFPNAQLVVIAEGRHNDLFTLRAVEVRAALSPFVRY
jgi:uncharacterized protein